MLVSLLAFFSNLAVSRPRVQVTVTNESEVLAVGWGQRSLSSSGRVQQAPGVPQFETRSVTLTTNGRHDHARWSMALEEAKMWKEGVDREVWAEERRWWEGGRRVDTLSSASVWYLMPGIRCDYSDDSSTYSNEDSGGYLCTIFNIAFCSLFLCFRACQPAD